MKFEIARLVNLDYQIRNWNYLWARLTPPQSLIASNHRQHTAHGFSRRDQIMSYYENDQPTSNAHRLAPVNRCVATNSSNCLLWKQTEFRRPFACVNDFENRTQVIGIGRGWSRVGHWLKSRLNLDEFSRGEKATRIPPSHWFRSARSMAIVSNVIVMDWSKKFNWFSDKFGNERIKRNPKRWRW